MKSIRGGHRTHLLMLSRRVSQVSLRACGTIRVYWANSFITLKSVLMSSDRPVSLQSSGTRYMGFGSTSFPPGPRIFFSRDTSITWFMSEILTLCCCKRSKHKQCNLDFQERKANYGGATGYLPVVLNVRHLDVLSVLTARECVLGLRVPVNVVDAVRLVVVSAAK